MLLRVTITSLILIILSGCTSVAKLGQLPLNEDDYLLSKEELVSKYPEIDRYEYKLKTAYYSTCLFCSYEYVESMEPPDDSSLPRKEDVLDVFGKPYGIKGGYILHTVIAGGLIVSGFGPVSAVAIPLLAEPTYKRWYFFEKGNYCVEVTFTRTVKTKYKSLMKGWNWHEQRCNEL